MLSFEHTAVPGIMRYPVPSDIYIYIYFFFFLAHFHFPASGQAVVTGVIPSPPRFLPSIFIAHRVQQSHCSSIVHRMFLTHALALSASQFVHKKKSQRIYTSMHSAGLELTKLTYTRLEDNQIRHRGDRHVCTCVLVFFSLSSFDYPLSVLLFFSRKLHPYWRSELDIVNKHTQPSRGQSALRIKQLLAISNRQMHQIMGLFFLPPSHLVVFFLARA